MPRVQVLLKGVSSLGLAVAGAVAWNFIEEQAPSLNAHGTSWDELLAIVCLAAMVVVLATWRSLATTIETMSEKTIAEVEEISKRNRLGIDYLAASSVEDQDKVFDAARRIVDKAHESPSCTIYAVNSFTELFAESDSGEGLSKREEYYDAIVRKAQYAHYHRVVQLSHLHEEKLQLAHRIASHYHQHFMKMIDLRDDPNPRRTTTLEIVPAIYPTSFLLIDNGPEGSYLIWQMNEHVYDDGEAAPSNVKLSGVMLITDPDRVITPFFREWFNRLFVSPRKRQIVREMLADS